MPDIAKEKTAKLRKMAEDKGIKGWEDMKRKELIEALTSVPKEEEEKVEEGIEEKVEKKGLGEGIEEGHVPVGSKAERMKEQLSKQSKVRILIPLEGKEKLGITLPVTLNGYRLNIMKGVYVDVPEQVAEIIMESQKQTINALNNPLNLDSPEHPKKKSGEGLGELNV